MYEAIKRASGEFLVKIGSDDFLIDMSILEKVLNKFAVLPEDVWTISYGCKCDRNSKEANLKYPEEIIDTTQYFSHPISKVDVLYFYRRSFFDAFMKYYSIEQSFTFYTSFLEVYLRHNCRQLVASEIAVVAGFKTDNITRGKQGEKYEKWAAESAIYLCNTFKDFEVLRGTLRWKSMLISAIYWCLNSKWHPWKFRIETTRNAITTYIRDYGTTPQLVISVLASISPRPVVILLRRLRDTNRRVHQ